MGLARVVASTICFPAADFVDPPSYYCWYFPICGIIFYGNVDELSAPHLFGFFPSFFLSAPPPFSLNLYIHSVCWTASLWKLQALLDVAVE